MCATCVAGVHGGWKTETDSLEQVLGTVVRCHVGAVNEDEVI